MPSYPYGKLAAPTELSFDTRFIRLDPYLSREGLIQCALFQDRIFRRVDCRANNRRYYALSYEWGPEHTLREIEVDGHRISVRQNLWEFLNVARQKSAWCMIPLWVDAMCIDQSNIQERNEQVSVMGDVYSCADQVLVWLGFGNAQIETIIRFLDHHHGSSTDVNLSDVLGDMEDEYSPAKVRAYNATFERSARVDFGLIGTLADHFDQIVSLTYWTRAWMAQELFNAKCVRKGPSIEGEAVKHLTFQYGSQSTTFECLHTSAAAIKEFLRSTDLRYWRFISFSEYMNMLNGVASKLDLHESFRIFNDWPAMSSDTRDLIYALRSSFIGGEHLQVDYGESLDLLLLRMMVQLKHSNSKSHVRNWLDFGEVRTVIDISLRFNMAVIDFRSTIMNAADKLKMTDMSKTALRLRQQYEDALAFYQTGIIHCSPHIQSLPPSMLWKGTGPCTQCYVYRILAPEVHNKDRECIECASAGIPQDRIKFTSSPCNGCKRPLLVPPEFSGTICYADSPALGVSTHLWAMISDPSSKCSPILHVLDMHLGTGPWRIQLSLPIVQSNFFTAYPYPPLQIDFQSWLLICAIEDIHQRHLPDFDERVSHCLQHFLNDLCKIAEPRKRGQAMASSSLAFWFVSTSQPGYMFFSDECSSQLTIE